MFTFYIMNTIELRDKINHFLAVNQINIAEFKHLIGTILLFISVGGLHGMIMKSIELKKTASKIIYYSILLILGAVFYLKFI